MCDIQLFAGKPQKALEAVVQKCSVKKGILKNFTKFTGKHLCQSLFLSKVASLRHATLLLKKSVWHRFFPVNFVKFLTTPISMNKYSHGFSCWQQQN